MTSLAAAIDRLRDEVAAGLSGRGDALGLAVDRDHFRDPDVVIGSDGSAEVVSVQPVASLTIDQLSDLLGTAKRLPRPPDGGPRTVLFADTLPGGGETAATVLAEIDADDRVSRLVVRADHY